MYGWYIRNLWVQYDKVWVSDYRITPIPVEQIYKAVIGTQMTKAVVKIKFCTDLDPQGSAMWVQTPSGPEWGNNCCTPIGNQEGIC